MLGPISHISEAREFPNPLVASAGLRGPQIGAAAKAKSYEEISYNPNRLSIRRLTQTSSFEWDWEDPSGDYLSFSPTGSLR
jgi:hypothetical protein